MGLYRTPRHGESVSFDGQNEDSWALYKILGGVGADTKVYVDTQDGHAYRVVALERDTSGDVVLKTVPQDPFKSKPKLRKHG